MGNLMNIPSTSTFQVDNHRLILVKGSDAFTFLQGQVTNDIKTLTRSEGVGHSSLGAHCTPKGRVLFSFRAFQLAADTVALAMYQPMIESALSSLKKYSIFSKVELIDASDQYHLLGIRGPGEQLLDTVFPRLPAHDNELVEHEGAIAIKLGTERYECWLPTAVTSSISTTETNIAGNELWTATLIELGIGEVRPETVEEFIPQMLNFQAVGNGISFDKGCYTGQEVVARMHYLGKLKKHLYRFQYDSDSTPAAGSPLYTPGNHQATGHVVIASPLAQQQELLAVVTTQSVEANQVFLDANCTQKIQALSLPYAINKSE